MSDKLEGFRVWWQSCEVCPSVTVAHAVVDSMPCPISTMYFDHMNVRANGKLTTLRILDVHTSYRFRRRGAATRLLQEIIESHSPDYVTTEAVSEAGKATMESFGFKPAKTGPMKGIWVYKVPKRKAAE